MYLDTRNNEKHVIEVLPFQHTFVNGAQAGSQTGDFRYLEVAKHIAEGFLPLTEVKPNIDSRYQTLVPQLPVIAQNGQSATRTWEIAETSLETLKTAKKDAVNSYWKLQEQGGFMYDGNMFDSDEQSVIRIIGALNATTSPPMWKTKDNEFVAIDNTYLQNMMDALASHANNLFAKANIHKATIDALETHLEVIEYSILTNWE